MKVTKEKIENSQAFLTIEMEPAEVEESLQGAYRRVVQKANIPGFRKGKAPRDIVERYVGREGLLDDAIKHLLPDAYEKAIAEQKLEAVAQPEIELVQAEPLTFKATVPLMPTVHLGDYHKIQLAPEPVNVTEEEVDKVIEQLRHQHATWEPVERPVEFNDMVVLDIASNVNETPFVNQKGVQYQVAQDSRFPVPGFSEQMVGMSRDAEKEFKLTLPADYPRAEMAGKEVSFKVKLNEIKQEKLPEVNDDFAHQVDPDFATVSVLRDKVKEQLLQRAEDNSRIEHQEKVVTEAVKLSRVEFPPVLAEMEVDHMLEHQVTNLQRGGIDIDEYLKAIKKTPQQLRDDLRPQANERVIRTLVLDKIALEEKIEATDAEVETEVEGILKSAGEKKEELKKSLDNSRLAIKQAIITRKTVFKLADIAKEPKTQESKEQVVEKEGKND